MSSSLNDTNFKAIQALSADKRYQYLIKQALLNKEIWILKDTHGCVMLNSDEEDCIPIWPHKEFADAWATDDWKGCKAQGIELDTWLSRWTEGLLEDGIAVAVFPDANSEGLVVYPDEFDASLRKT
ncbi:DUF2750 domain-containing protein [Agaribacter flavus]|uniref:DUF2750 domain-containing protein n=1 Tax=Agaribacter flavus TaxID=1902781 RepID=A0ABV7FLA0_9ALTE